MILLNLFLYKCSIKQKKGLISTLGSITLIKSSLGICMKAKYVVCIIFSLTNDFDSFTNRTVQNGPQSSRSQLNLGKYMDSKSPFKNKFSNSDTQLPWEVHKRCLFTSLNHQHMYLLYSPKSSSIKTQELFQIV